MFYSGVDIFRLDLWFEDDVKIPEEREIETMTGKDIII